MGPALAVGEARQEAAGGDAAGRHAAEVFHVGERGFDLLLVFVPERQTPGAVGGGIAGAEDFGGELVVLGHHAAGMVAQGDHAGAGQGGDIDHGFWLAVLAGPVDRIGQDHPALGIGVVHLDGLAVHRGDDIARPIGLAVGHVLDRSDHAVDVDRQSETRHGLDRADRRGGTTHVELHLLHQLARFDGNAAGVEGYALADHGHWRIAVLSAAPAHPDQARGVDAALSDRQQGIHAEFGHLVLIEDLDFQAVDLLGQPGRDLGQVDRCADIRGQIAQVTRGLNACRQGRGHGKLATRALMFGETDRFGGRRGILLGFLRR